MLIYFLIYFIIGILFSMWFFHHCYYESKIFTHAKNEEIILSIMLYFFWPIVLVFGFIIAIKEIIKDNKR